jgi:hypothetical protein
MSRARGVGLSSSFGGLSLSGGKGRSKVDAMERDISSHSRRKQDDEILAELERDSAGAATVEDTEEGSADALAQLHADTMQERKKKKAESPEKTDRKERTYTTSLPREDAHRFRATVSTR